MVLTSLEGFVIHYVQGIVEVEKLRNSLESDLLICSYLYHVLKMFEILMSKL